MPIDARISKFAGIVTSTVFAFYDPCEHLPDLTQADMDGVPFPENKAFYQKIPLHFIAFPHLLRISSGLVARAYEHEIRLPEIRCVIREETTLGDDTQDVLLFSIRPRHLPMEASGVMMASGIGFTSHGLSLPAMVKRDFSFTDLVSYSDQSRRYVGRPLAPTIRQDFCELAEKLGQPSSWQTSGAFHLPHIKSIATAHGHDCTRPTPVDFHEYIGYPSGLAHPSGKVEQGGLKGVCRTPHEMLVQIMEHQLAGLIATGRFDAFVDNFAANYLTRRKPNRPPLHAFYDKMTLACGHAVVN